MNLNYDKICEALLSNDREKIKNVSLAIQAFHNEPTTKAFKQKIQAMKIQALGIGVSTDFAETLNTSFNAFFELANFDLDYEKVFRIVPVSPFKNSWEIHTVKNGLAFRKVAEGETIEVYGMTSTKETIYADKYGGALGWTDELIRFREVAAMMDKAETFRNNFYVVKGNAHYLLISAAGALHITPWQGVVADGQLRRDIQTLNLGAYNIGNLCKDKGYGNTANARFVVFADPIFKSRIMAALRATTAGLQTSTASGVQVDANIEPVFTFNSNMKGKIVMGLPGLKAQRADIMAPTQFNETDILSLTYIQAVWAYYGAGIGDTEQFTELKFA
jgi:hypothetical protein